MEKEVSIGIYEILLVDIPFLCEKRAISWLLIMGWSHG